METKTSRKKNLKTKNSSKSENPTETKPSAVQLSNQSHCLDSVEKDHKCNDHRHSNLKEKLQHFIGLHSDAPAYIQDNDYIITGYRINFSTPKKVLQSLFIKHNESYNVWSHLVGALSVIFVMSVLFFQVMPSARQVYFNGDANCTGCESHSHLDRFSAILDKLPDLNKLEIAVKDKIEETRKDFRQFKESYSQELEAKLNKAVEITDKFAIKDATPHHFQTFVERLDAQILDIAQSFQLWEEELVDSVVAVQIKKTSKILKQKIEELKASISQSFIEKFDSERYDWVDVYKYIDHRDHSQETSKSVHRWPLFVALFSAAFCLMGSSVYHLACCMNPRVSAIFMRWDYAGISVLITGSCFPALVYGFYCQPTTATIYLTILSVTSLVVFVISLGDAIHTDKYRKWKGIMYGSLGVGSAAPVLHLIYNETLIGPGTDYLPFASSMAYYVAMGACYLVGLYLYINRLPEKFIPGKLDNCGNSHNLWHTLILVAIFFHYFGMFENYYTRMEISCNV
jgi:adiponectin receptor